MPVRFRNTEITRNEDNTRIEMEHTYYVASTREDCRDSVDAMVFDLVSEHGEMIKMGGVIGEPVDGPELVKCYRSGKGWTLHMTSAGSLACDLPRSWAERAVSLLNACNTRQEQRTECHRILAAIRAAA